jgi:hypothetical protein
MAAAALLSIPRDLLSVMSAQKIVRSRMLNRLGCQVARVAAAEALVRLRRRRSSRDMTPDEARLLRDGVVLVPSFIAPDQFDALLREIDRGEAQLLKVPPPPDKFGIVRQQIGVHKRPDIFPLANRLILHNERLLHAVRLAEGWRESDDFTNTGTVLKYERLEQATEPLPVSSDRDGEISSGDLHADTFHYVTKAFLTLNRITHENGPYTYAIGSQRLTARRLAWEYRNSLRQEQYGSEKYHNRMFEQQTRELDIEPVQIECERNTLILTNTFGFHLRGRMTRKGAVRRMLRLDFRSNPFRL